MRLGLLTGASLLCLFLAATLCLFLVGISGCGSQTSIYGKIVSRHKLTDEEFLVWSEVAECMQENGIDMATEVPVVDEIVLRESIDCGGVDARACTSVGFHISILEEFWHDGEPDDIYWSLFRHETKHWILGLATGNPDQNHSSIWFSAESPCPDE